MTISLNRFLTHRGWNPSRTHTQTPGRKIAMQDSSPRPCFHDSLNSSRMDALWHWPVDPGNCSRVVFLGIVQLLGQMHELAFWTIHGKVKIGLGFGHRLWPETNHIGYLPGRLPRKLLAISFETSQGQLWKQGMIQWKDFVGVYTFKVEEIVTWISTQIIPSLWKFRPSFFHNGFISETLNLPPECASSFIERLLLKGISNSLIGAEPSRESRMFRQHCTHSLLKLVAGKMVPRTITIPIVLTASTGRECVMLLVPL